MIPALRKHPDGDCFRWDGAIWLSIPETEYRDRYRRIHKRPA